MKYFFLSEGWRIGRVWELGGLWDELAWRRKPEINQMAIYMIEKGERLWLYRVEDAVIMLEVMPSAIAVDNATGGKIGQVVLKRLITAEQAIDLLCGSQAASALYEKADPASLLS